MSKRTKTLLLALGALVVLVGLFFAVKFLLPQQEEPSSSEESTSIRFLDFAAEEVASVTVERPNAGFVLLVDDGEYTIEGLEGLPLDTDKIESVIDQSSSMLARQMVDDSPDNLAMYGLDKPHYTVAVDKVDGSGFTLEFGLESSASYSTYVKVEGSNEVYLVYTSALTSFEYATEDFVSKKIIPDLSENAEFKSISFQRFEEPAEDAEAPSEDAAASDTDPAGDEPAAEGEAPSAEPAAEGEGASGDAAAEGETAEGAADDVTSGVMQPVGTQSFTMGRYNFDEDDDATYSYFTHGITFPYLRPVDQETLLTYVDEILEATADTVLAGNYTDEQLAEYGLDQPDSIIEVTFEEEFEEDVVFSFQLSFQDDLVYAICNDEPIIYTLREEDWMHLTYEEMVHPLFVLPSIFDLSNVTVETAGKSYSFSVAGEGSKDIQYEGKAIEYEPFSKFYQLVIGASNDGGYVPGTQPEGDPLLTITLDYRNDGNSDVLRFYDAGTRKMYVSVNGMIEFTMRSSYLEKLQEACEQVINGEIPNPSWMI